MLTVFMCTMLTFLFGYLFMYAFTYSYYTGREVYEDRKSGVLHSTGVMSGMMFSILGFAIGFNIAGFEIGKVYFDWFNYITICIITFLFMFTLTKHVAKMCATSDEWKSDLISGRIKGFRIAAGLIGVAFSSFVYFDEIRITKLIDSGFFN